MTPQQIALVTVEIFSSIARRTRPRPGMTALALQEAIVEVIAPILAPMEAPAFTIRVVDKGTGEVASPRLAWGDLRPATPVQKAEAIGHFSCFRIPTFEEVQPIPTVALAAWPFPVSAHQELAP